jgi:chemotaxis protein methyltransferase CheR
MFNVSIPEARNIIRAIKKTYGTDLSGIAMASFRIRLSEILQAQALNSTEVLIEKLLDNPPYYETFMRDISNGSPDMFRDPDFWIYFREELLPSILKSRHYPEIVIPESVTGHELYSMAVLLNEAKIEYRVDLVATCRNEKIRDRILEGDLPSIIFKNSKDNYELFNPGSLFDQYIDIRRGKKYLNPGLLKGVEIRLQSPDQPVCSDRTSLILYRNRMIYLNADEQYNRLKKLLGEMAGSTYFITGIRESIDHFGLNQMYSVISPDLKIYIKNHAD